MSETYPDGLAEFVRSCADDPDWTMPAIPPGSRSTIKPRAVQPAKPSEESL